MRSTLYLFAVVLFLGLPASAHALATHTTFYVDSAKGNDANTGTSEAAAWATVKNVNENKFHPGDRILFRAGQVWTGTLSPKGSGTEAEPIVLGRFGDGAKPLIQGNGAAQTLLLNEVSYWTVQDLHFTNHGPEPSIRNGIELHVSFAKVSSGLHLERVDVTDVNGEVGSKSAGGIGVMAWGKNGNSARFDDLKIEDCTIDHVDGQGIWFHVKGSRESAEDDVVGHTYPNTRIRITGTTISYTGRNAIFLRDALNASIDHNVVRHAAAKTHGNAVVVAGSKGTLIAHNEVSDTGDAGGGEDGAFDADDGAVETLIEFNWSHGNQGGMANIVNDPRHNGVNEGTIVRYNLSENDVRSVIGIGGAIKNSYVYNNTIFIGKHLSPKILEAGRFVKHVPGNPDGLVFANNVVFSAGGGYYQLDASRIVVDSNCFTKPAAGIIKMDHHGVIGDPGWDLSGLPIGKREEMDRYRLAKDSKCAQAGVLPVEAAGAENILGEKIVTPSRGAFGVRPAGER